MIYEFLPHEMCKGFLISALPVRPGIGKRVMRQHRAITIHALGHAKNQTPA